MSKAVWIWAAAGCAAGTILIMGAAGQGNADPTTCVRQTFHTREILDACQAGGQPAAKQAMKDFMRDHQIASCNACHEKLAPSYDLKADAYDQWMRVGGRILTSPVTITPAANASSFVPQAAPVQNLTPPGAGKIIAH